MMTNEQLYTLLLRSFDEKLSAQEQAALDKGLKQSKELQQKKKELEATAMLLANTNMAPSIPFFTGKVMTQIENLVAEKNHSLLDDFAISLSQMFPRFALSSLSLILLLVVGLYFSEGNLSPNTLLGASDISSELLVADYDYLNDFNY